MTSNLGETTMHEPVAKSADAYRSYRISPGDTNRLAIIFDPPGEHVPFIACVEIYDEGGKTPPNEHQEAFEMFFILKGTGRALCGGKTFPIAPGDSFLAPPGAEHVVENTGEGRLYALCVMIPNEGFSELIRAGEPDPLDEIDLATLRSLGAGS